MQYNTLWFGLSLLSILAVLNTDMCVYLYSASHHFWHTGFYLFRIVNSSNGIILTSTSTCSLLGEIGSGKWFWVSTSTSGADRSESSHWVEVRRPVAFGHIFFCLHNRLQAYTVYHLYSISSLSSVALGHTTITSFSGHGYQQEDLEIHTTVLLFYCACTVGTQTSLLVVELTSQGITFFLSAMILD